MSESIQRLNIKRKGERKEITNQLLKIITVTVITVKNTLLLFDCLINNSPIWKMKLFIKTNPKRNC